MAAGYRGRASTCFRVAVQKVEKGLQYAYRDRRAKKRDFRGLWIQRLNAALRGFGYKYSTFIDALNKKGVDTNRKILSELAIRTPDQFKSFALSIMA